MEVDVQAANVGRQTTQIFWKILQLNFSICTQKQNKKNKKNGMQTWQNPVVNSNSKSMRLQRSLHNGRHLQG